MDGDSFGTPPEAERSVNPSARGFPEIVFLNKTGLRAGWRECAEGRRHRIIGGDARWQSRSRQKILVWAWGSGGMHS